MTFVVLLVLLAAVARSVEAASLVKTSLSLMGIMLGAAGAAFFLASVRLPSPFLLLIGLGGGVMVVLWRSTSLVQEGSFPDRVQEIAKRTSDWFNIALGGGISTDIIPFALYLASLAWLLGFFSAWSVFRLRRVWLAIVVSGAALTIHLSYLPESFLKFLLWYLAASMVLLAWATTTQRIEGNGASHRQYVTYGSFLLYAAVVSICILALGWNIPLTGKTAPGFARTWNVTRSPWGKVESHFSRVFAGLPSVTTTSTNLGFNLPIRGALPLNANQPVMIVESQTPWYWKGRVFEEYTGNGWKSGEVRSLPLKGIQPLDESRPALERGRQVSTHTVEVITPTNVLFFAGQLVDTSVEAIVEVPRAVVWSIPLATPTADASLSPDLQALAEQVRAIRQTTRESSLEAEVRRLLPDRFALISISGNSMEVIDRQQAMTAHAIGLKSSQPITRGNRYQVVSAMSAVSADELRQSPSAYPAEIQTRYLQLPANFPERIKALAFDLTVRGPTIYDKMIAIEGYLRTLAYDPGVESPPPNTDSVDHFLFVQKRGHSDHFASAMVVLARSVGVPARLAAGYSIGSKYGETDFYLVTEGDQHRWPEIYFVGYGWVEFEPNPNRPPLNRPSGGTGFQDDASVLDELLGLDIFPDEFPFFLDQEIDFSTGTTFIEGGGLIPWMRIVLFIVYSLGGLIIVVVAWVTYWWYQGLWLAPLEYKAYERMRRLAFVTGQRAKVSETPYEFAHRLSLAFPQHKQDIEAIAGAYVTHRYGHRPFFRYHPPHLLRAWRRVRTAMVLRIAKL